MLRQLVALASESVQLVQVDQAIRSWAWSQSVGEVAPAAGGQGRDFAALLQTGGLGRVDGDQNGRRVCDCFVRG
jgi:hypothetical protein